MVCDLYLNKAIFKNMSNARDMEVLKMDKEGWMSEKL